MFLHWPLNNFSHEPNFGRLIYLYNHSLAFCSVLIFVTDFKITFYLFILFEPRIAFGKMQLQFSSVSTTCVCIHLF